MMKYIKLYEDLKWEFEEEELDDFLDSIPHNYIDYENELIGRKVKINKNSKYYRGNYGSSNPKEKVGTIIEINKPKPYDTLGIRVLWDKEKDITNAYSEKDLDLIR